jgi:hypothetical protein
MMEIPITQACRYCDEKIPSGILSLITHLETCPKYTAPVLDFTITLKDFEDFLKKEKKRT